MRYDRVMVRVERGKKFTLGIFKNLVNRFVSKALSQETSTLPSIEGEYFSYSVVQSNIAVTHFFRREFFDRRY